ncbi:hypothetical protein HHL16_08590 [Pseudoflavitalea sp. G-6-1-2]|uniref:hypothetical protein n=1 Tax=Pseudoflavitalea sp. G-6-1-2 TaxID=2728841 RepID=UPI00146C5BAF|nr:hypothetical protein [Pseudoflavitalea sp. G-6-1-2]NML20929.1 hypothetical protein [Pseudoflavitalea sp. G-6-1-2]
MKFCATPLLLCIILSLAVFSCKKGDTGPDGPPGTANVIYSAWFTPDKYIKDTVFGVWGFKYNKAAPEITQRILDSGVVLTFGRLSGYNPSIWPDNQVSQLPISVNYISGGQQEDVWSAYASPGNLRIRFTNDHNYWTTIANAHSFRYVIVPGGKAIAGLPDKSYREISNLYHLPN